MKRKLISMSTIICLTFIIINLFINSNLLKETIKFSLNIWFNNLVPTLFPFFIISNLLINIGFVEIIGNIFNNIMQKIFKVNGNGCFVFFMSILTGSPSNAKYINDLLNKGLINKMDATKLLCFTYFPNPLFIISISYLIFKSKKIGIIILIVHLFSNIITGIIFRNISTFKYQKQKNNFKDNLKLLNNSINNAPIFNITINAIKESINTLIYILGIITTCLILLNLVNTILNFNNLNKTFFYGLFEITSGLKYLNIINISLFNKIIFAMFFISFGGLSIHIQIMSLLNEKKINYFIFLLSRIICSMISIIIIIILNQMGLLL